MSSSDSINDFETSLQALEEIVNKMEQGQLSLEQSLDAFEQGVKLSKDCQNTLKSAQQRVSVLTQSDNGFELNALQEQSNT
ncbi:exodeoxyribonuclease VII small subunit, partial [Oleiphilus sp. HI0123]